MKPLKFVDSSLDDLRDFPEEARRMAGFELRAIQNGFEPRDWKPIQSVGAGAKEIRIHVLGEWRVIYVAKLQGCGVCVARISKENPKDGSARH